MQFLLFALSVNCDSPTVKQTANGPIEGKEETSSLGKKYYAFKGIPYAEAPITGEDPHSGQRVDRRFKVWYLKVLFIFVNLPHTSDCDH